MTDVADLTRNAVDVLPEGELERKLATGRQLRVKLGIDVTAPHVHVGHAIPLQRMAAFQRAGHLGGNGFQSAGQLAVAHVIVPNDRLVH